MGDGEVEHLVGGIAGEHGVALRRQRPSGQARRPVEGREQRVLVGRVGGYAGLGHLLGVVLAVSGDGFEADDR